jgi:hypothetical protein
LIYYFTSSDEKLTKDTWDIWSFFISFKKERPVVGSKGIIFRYNDDLCEVEELVSGAELMPIPFLTEEMKHAFIDGCFKAFRRG